MQCFHPVLVREWVDTSDGRRKKSNSFRYVPCGKCIACLQTRRSQWTYRLCQEADRSVLSYFVTFTYDDEHLLNNMFQYKNVVFPCFNKRDVQLYVKRLRKRLSMFNSDISVSYLIVSEYGSKTFRPHYHGLFFFKGCHVSEDQFIQELITDCWTQSSNYPVIQPTCQANIHYVTKYSLKDISGVFSEIKYFVNGGKIIGFSKKANTYLERPFMLCSTRPYLGSSIELDLETHIMQNGSDCTGVYLQGRPMSLPRILRQKSGVVGKPIEESPEPRLNMDQYKGYEYMYSRLHVQEDFDTWLNKQLKQREQRAMDVAARKSEKV